MPPATAEAIISHFRTWRYSTATTAAIRASAVAEAHGDDDVGGGEEHLGQFAALAVGIGVEQPEQEEGEADVDGAEADHPAFFDLPQAGPEQEGHQGDEEVDQVELLDGAFEQHEDLFEDPSRLHGGVGFLVLAAGEGMDEAVPGAGIAPVEGRVGGRRDRHVEVEGGADGRTCRGR
jgi:hypothetical protein